jgi:diacylglycerol kinase
MLEFFRSRLRSLRYAFSGWWHVIRTQRNAWIHAVVSLLVLTVCTWLRLPARDWALIILAIAMVWTAEFVNTAIEAVVDLAANHQRHNLARVSKDVGAAAVLIASLASILIGLLVIGPPLWEKIQGW